MRPGREGFLRRESGSRAGDLFSPLRLFDEWIRVHWIDLRDRWVRRHCCVRNNRFV